MRADDAMITDLVRSCAAALHRAPHPSRTVGGSRDSRAGAHAAVAPGASWFPAVILAAGLLASGAVAEAAWRAGEIRDEQSFHHATEIELQAILDQFGTYTALLRGAAGLFAAAHDEVSLADFRAYVGRVDVVRRYPGFLAIGFTPVLPKADRERLTAGLRAQGIADFTIHPTSDASLIAPIAYAEPANARNRVAIGFDVLTSPARREMVERARDSGVAATSARLQLQQEIDADKQAGFLVATPLYAGGTVPTTLEARRAAFRGFTFGAFRADDLFASIIATGAEDEAALVVYDGPPGEATLLHRSPPRAGAPDTADFRRAAGLEIGGRAWTVVFTSRAPRDRASAERDPWLIGGGGALATILLSLAALRQRRTQREVQRLNASLEARVAERTHDLLDVNERLREVGEERLKAEEQLRQSQKMEAVGQLTGGLAHDFNNLLTGIGGSLELLGRRLARGDASNARRYVATAQDAVDRAAALTHRLLAFARRQTLDPKPTDANRLVGGMEDMVRRTMGPAIAVETVLADALWPILCDPSQLENALLNLCINARDAMREGGRFTIATGNVELAAAEAEGHDMAPGDYVRLRVADTGTGMAPETAARAFDPFFTTKPLGQGTGLGLSMIYGFARQSGGQARIRSALGEGTAVEIDLPRFRGEVEQPLAPAATATFSVVRGGTVLVVDDEPSVRTLVVEVLTEQGFHVLQGSDGASGLVHLRSPTRIDLLVTDVGMPGGMNGRQLADAARCERPGLKVLFITGYAEEAVLGTDRLEPGMGVMVKPFAMEALTARIRSMLEDDALVPGDAPA